jgi:hypothetical protein
MSTREQQAAGVAFTLANACPDPDVRELLVGKLLKAYAEVLAEVYANEATPADIVASTAAFEKLLRARLAEMAEPTTTTVH